jgi:GT2 family glycosyltransferase
MRVLAHIHTFNDADVIDRTIESVMNQTRPVDGILVIDNASSDATLDQPSLKNATVVRQHENTGTSGAVVIGMQFALDYEYDWLWVLDADSIPRPDTLELLTRLVQAGDPYGVRELGIVCSSHNMFNTGRMVHGVILTPGGPRLPKPRADRNWVECNGAIWSGALINLTVVERVGLPRTGTLGCWEDLSLDYGDFEYTYRIHRAGYKILVHRDSILEHPLGERLRRRILGWDLVISNHTADRRYLYFRNLVYFWLRIYDRRNWPTLVAWFSYHSIRVLAGIVLLERERGIKLRACLLGIRDGLRGRLNGKFEASA